MSFYQNQYGFYYINSGGGTPLNPDKNIYVAKWDNTFTYGLQTIVAYNGLFYQSIITNNIGNTPTDVSAWVEVNNLTGMPPYRDNFIIADWTPDLPSGFYIDIPASLHQQGNDKFVYAFISSIDTLIENTPFGYGDFVQYSNGDIRIKSDTAFDGFISVTSFVGSPPSSIVEDWISGTAYNIGNLVIYLNNLYRCTDANVDIIFTIANWELIGSGGGTTNYNDLVNKPILNTNNITAQTSSSSEQIVGTIKLHKVSKTGGYGDLLNLPSIPTKTSDLTNDSNFYQTETELKIKVYNQPTQPTMTTDLSLAIWEDTSDSGHVYFLFRKIGGTIVAVDLT